MYNGWEFSLLAGFWERLLPGHAATAFGPPGDPRKARDTGWRAAFVAGLVLGGLGYAFVGGGLPVEVGASLPVLVVAGLLVGFGTRLGNGCTSGHGVSGIARLSKRSVAATATFMLAAILTVFVVRHVL